VRNGNSARSVISVIANVNELTKAPLAPVKSGSADKRRCAAFLAFSTLSPASAVISLILAPPRALMPPAALMSSTAICAPLTCSSPLRAHGPDSGTMTASLISLAAVCAQPTEVGSAQAARAAMADATRWRRAGCCANLSVFIVSPVENKLAMNKGGSQPTLRPVKAGLPNCFTCQDRRV